MKGLRAERKAGAEARRTGVVPSFRQGGVDGSG